MGERRERAKPRNTNRGSIGTDKGVGMIVGRGGDGTGKSNGEKVGIIVTEQQ